MDELKQKTGGRQLCIAIDFDGTICNHAPFPEIGPIKIGAKESIQLLKELGWKIIIFTCRTGNHQIKMIEWLRKEQVPFDGVNYNPDCPEANQKPMADIYLDDRSITFENNWVDIPEIVRSRLLHLPIHIYKPSK